MNLFELKKISIPDDVINDFYPNDYDKFDKYLEFFGFSIIGSGGYSKVYEHKKLDYVIKVFEYNDNYTNYIHFCKNASYINTPKFRGNIMKSSKFPNIAAIRMEKLNRCTYEIFESFQKLIRTIYNLSHKEKERYSIYDQIVGRFSKGLITPDLIELSIDIIVTFGRFDLHQDNIMLRNNSTIVIIDPI